MSFLEHSLAAVQWHIRLPSSQSSCCLRRRALSLSTDLFETTAGPSSPFSNNQWGRLALSSLLLQFSSLYSSIGFSQNDVHSATILLCSATSLTVCVYQTFSNLVRTSLYQDSVQYMVYVDSPIPSSFLYIITILVVLARTTVRKFINLITLAGAVRLHEEKRELRKR